MRIFLQFFPLKSCFTLWSHIAFSYHGFSVSYDWKISESFLALRKLRILNCSDLSFYRTYFSLCFSNIFSISIEATCCWKDSTDMHVHSIMKYIMGIHLISSDARLWSHGFWKWYLTDVSEVLFVLNTYAWQRKDTLRIRKYPVST